MYLRSIYARTPNDSLELEWPADEPAAQRHDAPAGPVPIAPGVRASRLASERMREQRAA